MVFYSIFAKYRGSSKATVDVTVDVCNNGEAAWLQHEFQLRNSIHRQLALDSTQISGLCMKFPSQNFALAAETRHHYATIP